MTDVELDGDELNGIWWKLEHPRWELMENLTKVNVDGTWEVMGIQPKLDENWLNITILKGGGG